MLPACEVFARRFTGEIWTYGSYEADQQIGGIRLRVVAFDEYQRRKAYLAYTRVVLARARELAARRQKNVVVVSYDPFKNGLLARRVARLTGGVFISEVNGAYGNTDNFADEPRMWMRRFRILLMRIVGSYVLRGAHGVRLLYDDQLEGFARARRDAIVRRFFDLTFIDRFRPGPDEKFILLAGHPFRRKGVDLLTDAFLKVADKYPEWKLVMVGHGLPDSVRSRGVTHPRIEVLPGTPQPQLVDWVARCSFLALPSRSEAMGRILIEAATAAKCRVATRVDGIPTVVEDGFDGLLVDKESVDSLAAALDRLMGDGALRAKLGENARTRATSQLSPEAYLDHYASFIDAVLERHGK